MSGCLRTRRREPDGREHAPWRPWSGACERSTRASRRAWSRCPGHYASVLRLDDRTGLALSTDTVGTKMVVAERLGPLRHDRDRLRGDERQRRDLRRARSRSRCSTSSSPSGPTRRSARSSGIGLARGAELAGIEIPGGEIAQVGDIVSGQELGGTCVGLVDLDAIVTGAGVEPGDPVIGLPSSGLHSNGYTLARAALADVSLDDDRLGRPLGDVLLEPTEIYVRPILELLASPVDGPRPRPHHRRRASTTCCGSRPRSGTRSTTRCRCRRSSG